MLKAVIKSILPAPPLILPHNTHLPNTSLPENIAPPIAHCHTLLHIVTHCPTYRTLPPKLRPRPRTTHMRVYFTCNPLSWQPSVNGFSMTHKSKPLTENVTFCPLALPHLGLKVFFWEIFRLEDFVFENIFRRTSDHFVPSVPPLASWACPPEKLIKPDKDKTFEFRPLIICLPIQSWAHLSFLLTINHAPRSVLVGWS